MRFFCFSVPLYFSFFSIESMTPARQRACPLGEGIPRFSSSLRIERKHLTFRTRLKRLARKLFVIPNRRLRKNAKKILLNTTRRAGLFLHRCILWPW